MFAWPKKLLMVRPNGFRVEYAINPYMRDKSGQLNQVDATLAMDQWEVLRQTFVRLGLEVEILEGDPAFPDMVFCANQTLPYLGPANEPQVILSRMHSAQRQGEIRHFANWAQENAIPSHPITDFDFEGAGDALWNYHTRELLGGYGIRSNPKVYPHIEKLTGTKVHKLELISEHFYHLDTCLAILNGETVAYVPEAFAGESRALIERLFSTLIEIPMSEAKEHFAGNCVSVDGKHIVLQSGAPKFTQALKRHGFIPVDVDTREFIKAGGSAFCMKQFFF